MATVRMRAESNGSLAFCEIIGSMMAKLIQPTDCQSRRTDQGRVIALVKLRRFDDVKSGSPVS